MLRFVLTALVLGGLVAQTANGQAVRSRSGDYLFASTATDTRALWVNPAGLAVSIEASVLAEFVLERPVDGDLRLAQWSVGFNSRGFALSYQRDRFSEDPNTGAFRFGLALPFQRGAIGAAFTFYRGNTIDSSTDRGIDLGARYRLLRPLELAVVLRNVGRPVLRDAPGPLTGLLSAAWHPLPGRLVVAAEALAAERLAASGYDVNYRGGLHLSLGRSLPVLIMGALDFSSSFSVNQWAVGVAVGRGGDHVLGLVSGGTVEPADRLERMSLTGVASRSLQLP